MTETELNYEIKGQVKLFVGERPTNAFDSGCKMFDLVLGEPNEFDSITFQNFYTGYLSIKAKRSISSTKLLQNGQFFSFF